MVVTSANSDLYSPFSHRSMPEESGPSSEEGSGLHSPIFGVQYAHPDANLRYRTEHDIQNAAGILASQFDHNSGYSNMAHHQQHPGGPNANQLLDATLEPGPNSHNPSQHPAQNTASHRYPADAYQPNPNMHPRNHLGIDIPVQTLSNTRLPPPPGQVYFDQSPDGHRHAQHYPPTPQDTGYGGSGGGPGGMMDPHGHQHHDQQQAAPGSATSSGGREPRKESSGVVIACRQCRARKIRCDSTRPVCNNCVRRSNECHYDAAPKRRGPDKRPGTRQRSCKKRPADGSAPPPPSKRKRSGAGASGEEMGQGGAMKNTFPVGAGMGPGPMPQQGYDVVGRGGGVGGMQGGMQMHPQHLPRLSPGAGMDLKPPRGMEQGQMFAV